MSRAFYLLILLGLACTEQPEVIPYDYTKVFTGEEKKGWVMRNFQYVEAGKGPVASELDECIMDDIFIFYANEERRAEVWDGDEKCSPDDPDLIMEGTWGFSNTGASLTIPFPIFGGTVPFVVREAREDRMSLEIFFSDGSASYRFNFIVEDLE